MSALRVETSEELENLEDFRQRARSFIRANLRKVGPKELRWERNVSDDEAELVTVGQDRELQRMLFDAGLAGICFPREYGGQGLSHEHQKVSNEELRRLRVPPAGADPHVFAVRRGYLRVRYRGAEVRHIPAILKGEELWMQLLSEPSGGSDVAGALTTAVRDGSSGSSTDPRCGRRGRGGRTGGSVSPAPTGTSPKHRGLTVFMLPIHQPNVEVHRIEMLNGSREFCQEFMTDVIVPDTDRIGGVDEGWTVAPGGCSTSDAL